MKALENNLYVNAVDDDAEHHAGDLHRGQYELATNSTSASVSLWPPYELYPMRVDFVHVPENESCGEHWQMCGLAQGSNTGLEPLNSTTVFPAKHHITDSEGAFQEALRRIDAECAEQAKNLRQSGKNTEAERLQQRVANDLLLLKESGSCPGVENYSRHLHLRDEGESPDTLLDYFGLSNDGWQLIIDESHVALPQLKAMYAGVSF
jgi:excinuclease UvrABC helicase subunit UvrB